MERYHLQGDKAPRNTLVYAALEEIRQGRGPIYIDSRHLPPDKISHLKKTLGLDKETLNDFLSQKGIDIARQPLEVMVSEAMQTGPVEVVGSGIKIDEHCQSSIPGLFAAGDCADQMKVVHMAVTGGYAAGKCAYHYLKNRDHHPISKEELEREEKTLLEPRLRKRGISYRELEEALRQVMTEHCGPYRTEPGLREGLAKIAALKPFSSEIKVASFHDLMRAMETRSLMTVGEIMFHAALYRKESRFIPYHYRLDYPQTDNDHWHGQVLVRRDGEGMKLEFMPMVSE
jgi:adenylylsulfate reductase subunit A